MNQHRNGMFSHASPNEFRSHYPCIGPRSGHLVRADLPKPLPTITPYNRSIASGRAVMRLLEFNYNTYTTKNLFSSGPRGRIRCDCEFAEGVLPLHPPEAHLYALLDHWFVLDLILIRRRASGRRGGGGGKY